MPVPYICSACRHRLQAAARKTLKPQSTWSRSTQPARRLVAHVATPAVTQARPSDDQNRAVEPPAKPPELSSEARKKTKEEKWADFDPLYRTSHAGIIRYRHPVLEKWDADMSQLEEQLFSKHRGAGTESSVEQTEQTVQEKPSESQREPDEAREQSLFEDDDMEDGAPALHTEVERWKEMWQMADEQSRAHQFPDLMMRYLRQESPFTLTLLMITLDGRPLPDKDLVSNVLDISVLHARLALSGKTRRDRIEKLYQLTSLVLKRYPTNFPLTTRMVKTLLYRLEPRKASTFIAVCLSRLAKFDHYKLDPQPLVVAAEEYALSRPSRSLAILSRVTKIPTWWASVGPQVSDILERCMRSKKAKLDSAFMASIVKLMSDCNSRLMTQHYNILIKRQTDALEIKAAWNTYRTMQASSVTRDAMTYAVMMNFCRRSAHYPLFRQLHREVRYMCSHQPALKMSEDLLCNWLLTSYAFESHAHDRQYAYLIKIYREFADMRPLEALGIATAVKEEHLRRITLDEASRLVRKDREQAGSKRKSDNAPQDTLTKKRKLLSPNSQLLGFMIWAWLRAHRYQPGRVLAVYIRFRVFALAGAEWLKPAIGSKFVWDAFLYALTWSNSTKYAWGDVLNGMFDPYVKNTELAGIPKELRPYLGRNNMDNDSTARTINALRRVLERSEGGHAPTSRDKALVPANAQTWNILMNGFARHNMPEAAEAVCRQLLRRNAQDAVSWNTLIKAWAIAGNETKVKQAIELAEKHGHVSSAFTAQAIQGPGQNPRVRELLGNRVRGGGLPTRWERNDDGTFNNMFLEEYGRLLPEHDQQAASV